jgi:hypothetical protein
MISAFINKAAFFRFGRHAHIKAIIGRNHLDPIKLRANQMAISPSRCAGRAYCQIYAYAIENSGVSTAKK